MQANFFDHKAIQGFLIREKRQITLPGATGAPAAASPLYVAAMLAELAQLGFTFDADVTDALKQLDVGTLSGVRLALIDQLKEAVGAHVKYRPLFRNFPDDIPEDFEYLSRKAIGYLQSAFGLKYKNCTVLSCGHVIDRQVFDIHQFGGCPVCQRAAPELDASKPGVLPLMLTDAVPLKMLSLASHDDVLTVFANAAQSRTSLSESYKEFMRGVLASATEAAVSRLPEDMPFKENMALVVGMLVQVGAATPVASRYIKTSTDVLRIAAALSGGDLSLAEVCKFKLSNSQRRFIMAALEKLPQSKDQLLEDMVAYLGRWVRLGEVLHIGQYASRYPKAAQCFDVLRNSPESIVTYDAAVGRLFDKYHMSKSEGAELLALLSKRPGEFARKLDKLLQRGGLDETVVLEKFKAIAGALATPMLLTLLAHFRNRGEQAEFRAFMPKGSVAKMFIVEGDSRHTLSLTTRSEVIAIARKELVARFAKKPSLGKVFIEDGLDRVLVPTSQRSASTGLVTVPRGSRVPFNTDKNFLRLFIHWMETPETDRIDVDLTAGLYDENWSLVDQMSWTNMSSFGRSTHSGDVRSAPAPHGAAEFIDVDLDSVKKHGVRYVLMNVYSWTGQKFKDFPAFAGFMEREDTRDGDHFEAKTVVNKFALASDTTAVAPMAVDLETGDVIWMDMTLKAGGYGSIESQGSKMVAMAKAIEAMRNSRVSLYDLFELHAEARGTMVSSKDEAEVVLDMGQLMQMDDIVANWL